MIEYAEKPKADFEPHERWGDAIVLSSGNDWPKMGDEKFTAYGHGFKSGRSPKPEVGSTLVQEFERSWIVFKIVSIDWKRDPRDMFTFDAVIDSQVMKEKS